jgi:hypothetical protein
MRNFQDLAAETEKAMSVLLPEIICVAQEWDERIDCMVRLSDGSIVGEMIFVKDLCEDSIRNTASRLKQKITGESVSLIHEIFIPVRIDVKRRSKD